MKIRSGFVSNSSSSSFIIIGVKRLRTKDVDFEDFHNMIDDEDFENIETIWTESDEYDCITGMLLCDNDEYLEEGSLSYLDLETKSKKVAEALKVDISKVSLIYGTRPC